MRYLCCLAVLVVLTHDAFCQTSVTITESADELTIDTDALQAKIRKNGYVSGVAAGSLRDKMTGAKDAGFGLHIMDFLLGPGWTTLTRASRGLHL